MGSQRILLIFVIIFTSAFSLPEFLSSIFSDMDFYSRLLRPIFFALDAVGEIIGEAGTEEILGEIFSSFCIGK